MRPAEWLQEAIQGSLRRWRERRLSQEEAARIVGVSDRTFRRYVERYEDGGLEALVDRRLSQAAHNKAPVDEVLALTERYRARHDGWTAQHFHSWYSFYSDRASHYRRSHDAGRSPPSSFRQPTPATPRRSVPRKISAHGALLQDVQSIRRNSPCVDGQVLGGQVKVF